jgi:choline-sulfatase
MRTAIFSALVLASCGTEPPPEPVHNVIVITLDTVRADHIGTYGFEGASTPNIDKLGSEGTLFTNAIAVAPITMPTHSSIFTGKYPHNHGVRNNGSFRLGQENVTLAERFSEAGRQTGAMVSAVVLDSKYGLDQGFDTYDDNLYAGGDQPMFMFKEITANVTIDKALRWIDDRDESKDFMVWMHLFDAHAEYQPPPPYDVLFLDNPYDGEIAWLDSQLGRLFDELKAKGLYENTTIVLTADHGDSLGDHGEFTHGIFVYRSTTHIPLIIRGPGIKPQRVKEVVSQVDITPTILDMANLPPVTADGVSLKNVLYNGAKVPNRPGVFAESISPRLHFGWHEIRAIDSGDEKFIHAPTRESYDLLADPKEATNLYKQGSTSPLITAVDQWIAKDDLVELNPAHVDAETTKMLEALGYVGDLVEVEADQELPDPKDRVEGWVELQRCQGMVRQALHEQAVACFRALLAEDPGSWTAQMSLAGVLRRMGHREQAVTVLEGVLKDDPTNTRVLMALGGAYEGAGKEPKALETLKAAADLAPDDPEPWNMMAKLHQSHGRHLDAIRAFGEALRRDRIYVDAYLGVAASLHTSGNSERAVTYLEQALEIEPTNMAAIYNLGVILDHMGHTEKAETTYRKALQLDPSHALSHNNLGSLLDRTGRKEEAEREFRLALQAKPDHVEAKYNLATLMLSERPERAVPLLREVVAARPNLVPARHNLAMALAEMGRVDEALAQHQYVADKKPEAPGPILAMAGVQARHGRKADARANVAKAIALGGDDVKKMIADDPVLSPLIR